MIFIYIFTDGLFFIRRKYTVFNLVTLLVDSDTCNNISLSCAGHSNLTSGRQVILQLTKKRPILRLHRWPEYDVFMQKKKKKSESRHRVQRKLDFPIANVDLFAFRVSVITRGINDDICQREQAVWSFCRTAGSAALKVTAATSPPV